jgi:hypothetical protein
VSEKLLAWPTMPRISLLGPQWTQEELIRLSAYHHELAAAWEARARVAVAALREIEDESRLADDDNECADETHHLAMETLAAIGELPPEGM